MPRSPRSSGWAILATLWALWLAGCDKSQLPSIPSVNDIKQKVDNGVEAVRQTADIAGSIEVTLDQELRASGCYAALLPQAGGRATILQITSYNNPSGESFPSCFFRSKVTATKASELVGQKVTAEAYFQASPNAPVWQTPDGEPAQLAITAADDATITGLFDAFVINSDTGERLQISGKLHGSVAPIAPAN